MIPKQPKTTAKQPSSAPPRPRQYQSVICFCSIKNEQRSQEKYSRPFYVLTRRLEISGAYMGKTCDANLRRHGRRRERAAATVCPRRGGGGSEVFPAIRRGSIHELLGHDRLGLCLIALSLGSASIRFTIQFPRQARERGPTGVNRQSVGRVRQERASEGARKSTRLLRRNSGTENATEKKKKGEKKKNASTRAEERPIHSPVLKKEKKKKAKKTRATGAEQTRGWAEGNGATNCKPRK